MKIQEATSEQLGLEINTRWNQIRQLEAEIALMTRELAVRQQRHDNVEKQITTPEGQDDE